MIKIYVLIIVTTIIQTACFTYAAPELIITNFPVAKINIMTLRDPFWPQGWRPPDFGKKKSMEQIKSPIKWREAASKLRIAGLSKKSNGDYIAIIKGYGIIEKGETLAVNYQGLIYKWTIKNITAEGIERKRLSVSMR